MLTLATRMLINLELYSPVEWLDNDADALQEGLLVLQLLDGNLVMLP